MKVSIPEPDAEFPADSAFFIKTSLQCNTACRGWHEPFYVALVLHAVAAYLVFLFGDSASCGQMLTWAHAILFAQVTLAGIWLTQGKSPLHVRILGSLAVLVTAPMMSGNFDWQAPDISGLLRVQMVFVAVPLTILRCLGWQFQDGIEAVDGATFQFGIRDLMGWTVGAAVLLAAGRCCVDWLKSVAVGWLYSNEFVLGGALAATVLAMTFAMLGRRHLVARFELFFAVLTGASFTSSQRIRGHEVENLVNLLIVPTVIIGLTLWTVRMRGYRLQRVAMPLRTAGFRVGACAP